MSNVDGENPRVYTKTLNGLDALGDTDVGDLVVTGTLTVEGASSMEAPLDMNSNQINFLASGTALTDAVNLGQLTTTTAGFLKIDGTNAMTATMDVGTQLISNVVDGVGLQDAATVNQITGIGAGVFLKLDGSDTMAGDIQMGANNITNCLDITTDSLKVTGTSTAGVGSVTFNGLAYTYPAIAPAVVGQTLQNTTTISPYTLAWTTPATPVVAIDSGSAQTNLAIMGTAPILSGAVGVVQSIYAGTIAAPSARINMNTGNISTAGDMGCNNMILQGNISAINPTTGLPVITTLPQYNRQVFRTCIRLDGTIINSGFTGIGNFVGAGGWVNNYLQPTGLPLPPFGGFTYNGGFINFCFRTPYAGIIKSCELTMPYGETALTISIVEANTVAVGGVTGANLVAGAVTPLAVFSQVGVSANFAWTLTPSVSVLPTAGAFAAGVYLAVVITPTYSTVTDHDALAPASQYYNLTTTIDFEYT